MFQQELDQAHARTKLWSVKELDGIGWIKSHTLKGKSVQYSLASGRVYLKRGTVAVSKTESLAMHDDFPETT